jgi:twitching motility protein PilT
MTSPGEQNLTITRLLYVAVTQKASDLHLCVGAPPILRINGNLTALNAPPITPQQSHDMIYAILNNEQRQKFEENWELDFSAHVADVGRFRVNIHRQRGAIEGAFRVISEEIRCLKDLGLPPVVEEITRKESGLILVTGPTGSGKTTTMAAMIDRINATRSCMIITIEDPIEFLHRHKRSIVKQRELMADTKSFSIALRHALRQDPDVISIGEMRDLDTMETALTAAETGHLVLATVHTPDTTQTIDRIIDVFPSHQQEQVRIQLANALQAIIAQQLLPIVTGQGRAIAVEILLATPAVRKIIRSKKTEQIMTVIQTSSDLGMISMDKSLKNLYQQGLISYDNALAKCLSPETFAKI